MLHTLFIQDYALIQKLQISFEQGFSVVTGETGAGKSIILGAIGLLLGQRAEVKAIRTGASKCVIEACFVGVDVALRQLLEENELDADEECILRREVSASGKSRAFINDTPVQLSVMKLIGERLIDIHSQHQNLLLNQEDFQLNVLDVLAKNGERLGAYKDVFRRWKEKQKALQALREQAARDKAEEDYLQFQYNQLEEADIHSGEQEELEQEAEMMSHAEDIKSGLYRAEQTLSADDGGLLDSLRNCKNAVQGIVGVYPAAEELQQRLESAYIELEDIAQELRHHEERVEFNPDRLDAVNERLNLLYSLLQKHHAASVEELISLRQSFEEKLRAINNADDDICQLEQECTNLYEVLRQQATTLTECRRKVAVEVERQMKERLVLLGMPNVRFKVEMGQRSELTAQGEDNVNFLFCANKSGTMQSISQVASGGEVARVMLSLKALIANAVQLPTIIFDEIDTGVSGSIADRMASIMREMGEGGRQVISITHLPQIAARGRVHYKVYKEDKENETISYIRRLTEAERVEEIAHMLSGASLTPQALSNAEALLAGDV